MKVTVYSLEDTTCHQCRFTKRKLDSLDIPYVEVRADLDASVVKFLKEEILGDPDARLSMPVVRVDLGDDAFWTWTGYSPSQIERLAEVV